MRGFCFVRGILRSVATEVRTPFSVSAVELSGGGLYRKQVLKFGTILYTDKTGKRRKMTFDREYGNKLVAAFKAGAYPQVPFQLADADNRHTNAPDRTGGEVVGVELSSDGSGVDAYLRTWGTGTQVIEQNPNLGVSARLFENITMTDGRTFPVAMQHVLGTVDPQVRGMRPWEKVDSVDLASTQVTEALDLSARMYERSVLMPGTKDKEPTTTVELSVSQVDRLKELLEDDEALEALAEQLGDDFFDAVDDDEEEEESPEDEEPEETALAVPGAFTEAIELAQSQLAAQGRQIVELSAQLNSQRVDTEVAGYQRQGLAPAILELARPLLEIESGAIELSNGVPGGAVDPGTVVREVLDAVIELSSSGHLIVDPTETGSLQGSDADKSERDAMLADWDNYS